MTTLQKFSTSIITLFLLMPGLVKFTDKFKTMFTVQIAESGLPFPRLSFILGQTSEILTGLLLFSLLFFWKRFPDAIAYRLFQIGNLLVIPIMLIAVYVHLHPDVPVEVLPFESKPPYLAVTLLIGSGINLYTHRTNMIRNMNN